jgi:hypothetical protein
MCIPKQVWDGIICRALAKMDIFILQIAAGKPALLDSDIL